MKEFLKSAGLYIGFLATIFLVLCFIYKDNRVQTADNCFLKSESFSPEKFIGHEVIDLVHCRNKTNATIAFYWDDGESYVKIPYSDMDVIIDMDMIIVEYEHSDYDEDDDPTTSHYIFRVVYPDDERAKASKK